MPKRGNWGDRAVIDLPPIEVKYVSCYACIHYYREDGSCIKTPIIPHKDGNKIAWKNCKYFELSPEYMTPSFVETVRKVKGKGYLAVKSKHSKRTDETSHELICDYEIGSWIKSDHFGTGRLVEVYPGKIVIDFKGEQHLFKYPESFDKCLLFLVHPPVPDVDEAKSTEIGTNIESGYETKEVENAELINDNEQCIEIENIGLEKSETDRENEDTNVIQTQEHGKQKSSFIEVAISWVKSFFGR